MRRVFFIKHTNYTDRLVHVYSVDVSLNELLIIRINYLRVLIITIIHNNNHNMYLSRDTINKSNQLHQTNSVDSACEVTIDNYP